MTAELPPLDYRLAPEPVVRGRDASPGDLAARASGSWRDAVVGAAAVVAERPALVGVGLLGFLARGGFVLFLLPIVALPTPTGISNFIGGTALTGGGASEGFVRLIAATVVGALTLVIIGTIVGAVADLLLVRAAFGGSAGAAGPAGAAQGSSAAEGPSGAPVRGGLLLKISVIRLMALVPVAVVVAWAAARLVAAGYRELILPDDLTVPLAVRIIRSAADAVALVALVWLAAELIGGLAVREVLEDDASVRTALGNALLLVARRPFTTFATFGLSVVAFVVSAAPVLLVSALLWSRLQALLADDAPPWLVLPTTFLFVVVWGGGLLLVGLVVTWRGILTSLDVRRAGHFRLRP